MKACLYVLICAWSVTCITTHAQSAQGFEQQLPGAWEGAGSLFGQAATFSMEWEHTLNERFLSLEFQNSFKDNSGTERSMQARALYNLGSGKGYWFDSRGQILPLVFEIARDSMTVFWGDEATEKGKTIYRLTAGAMEVEDFVFREAAYVPFGAASYKKQE